MKRLFLVILVFGGGIYLVGRMLWNRIEDSTRQAVRVRLMDFRRAVGLGLPTRDIAHMRKRSGLNDTANVSCRNCHFESTNALAWAQPHPRHASPGGLAVSPDGQRLYVALPELEDVVEVDVTRLEVIGRVHVPGEPTGLAMAPDGSSLFVACRGWDRVVRLGLTRGGMVEVESVNVGLQPVGIACAVEGTNGLRIVVANTFSDDAYFLTTEPLREAVRFSTGREPYGVGFSRDGGRALVVSRLAVTSGIHRPPASEITVFDTQTGRATDRARLDSAHLAESVATVPGRTWVLAPMVRVRNLVPITQVARGWVISSGLALMEPDGSVVQVPVDEANRYFADPGGLVVDARGHRAYLASGGGDAVSVVALTCWIAGSRTPTRRAVAPRSTIWNWRVNLSWLGFPPGVIPVSWRSQRMDPVYLSPNASTTLPSWSIPER